LVNGFISKFLHNEIKEQNLSQAEEEEALEKIEEEHFYNPLKGNVAFCSAYHNWAFTLKSWAVTIAEKLEMTPNQLT
jgi:hypothetical protein